MGSGQWGRKMCRLLAGWEGVQVSSAPHTSAYKKVCRWVVRLNFEQAVSAQTLRQKDVWAVYKSQVSGVSNTCNVTIQEVGG